jgi:predicted TIM-barrel fold metal-dependent hydrolase
LEGYRQLAEQDSEFQDRRIFFDLSGAIISDGSQEAIPTSDEQCQRLSEQMKQVGIQRFLFASDYPVFPVAETRSSLSDRLSLTPNELKELLNNRSPRFGGSHR